MFLLIFFNLFHFCPAGSLPGTTSPKNPLGQGARRRSPQGRPSSRPHCGSSSLVSLFVAATPLARCLVVALSKSLWFAPFIATFLLGTLLQEPFLVPLRPPLRRAALLTPLLLTPFIPEPILIALKRSLAPESTRTEGPSGGRQGHRGKEDPPLPSRPLVPDRSLSTTSRRRGRRESRGDRGRSSVGRRRPRRAARGGGRRRDARSSAAFQTFSYPSAAGRRHVSLPTVRAFI